MFKGQDSYINCDYNIFAVRYPEESMDCKYAVVVRSKTTGYIIDLVHLHNLYHAICHVLYYPGLEFNKNISFKKISTIATSKIELDDKRNKEIEALEFKSPKDYILKVQSNVIRFAENNKTMDEPKPCVFLQTLKDMLVEELQGIEETDGSIVLDEDTIMSQVNSYLDYLGFTVVNI